MNEMKVSYTSVVNDLGSIQSGQIKEGKSAEGRSVQQNSTPIINGKKMLQVSKLICNFIKSFQSFRKTISIGKLSTSIGFLLSLLKKSITPTKMTSQSLTGESQKALPSSESINNQNASAGRVGGESQAVLEKTQTQSQSEVAQKESSVENNMDEQEKFDENVAAGVRFFQKYCGIEDEARAKLLAKLTIIMNRPTNETMHLFSKYDNKQLEELCNMARKNQGLNVYDLKREYGKSDADDAQKI